MAVDKSILDAITGGYKFYLDDMKSKNITGQYYDEVERLFKRIEELGEECSDMNELYAKMQNENITVKMSDAYTRALTEEGNKKYMPQNGEIPDDSQLFKNNLDALRNCIKSLRDNFDNVMEKATESERMRLMVEGNPEALIKSIEDMIALAEEPGMTYANFLRLQIERGLDKAAQDVNVWNLISDRIERKYRPDIIKRDKIYDLFHTIIGDLGFWSIAHCPFAPTDVPPWSMMKSSRRSLAVSWLDSCMNVRLTVCIVAAFATSHCPSPSRSIGEDRNPRPSARSISFSGSLPSLISTEMLRLGT